MADYNAFDAEVLADDLMRLQAILRDLFSRVKDWNQRTARVGWTLGETVGHLLVAADVYESAIESTLKGIPFSYPGLNSRADLANFNEMSIRDCRGIPPKTLARLLLETLERASEIARWLTPEQLAMTTDFCAYNRPITVAELLGNHLVHPGITHGAQIGSGTGRLPLWTAYSLEFMQRQLTRFFCGQMSPSYWPERGHRMRASVNFIVPGAGRWYVTLDPDGGSAGIGAASRPALTLWTRSTDVVCGLFTRQISPIRALLSGQAIAWGNPVLGFRLPRLFRPA
jgi:hypothetical protein